MRWAKRSAVLVAIAALTLLVARFAVATYSERRLAAARARLQEEVGSLDLARLRPSEVPPDRNTARWIEAAIEDPRLGVRCLGIDAPDCPGYGSLKELRAREWDEETLFQARKLIGDSPAFPALLSRLADSSASSFGIDYERGFAAKLPDMLGVMRLAGLIAVAARAELVSAELENFSTAAAAEAAIARALCTESMLFTNILGQAVERLHLALVADYLASGPPDAAVLAGLAEDVEKDACRSSLRRSMEGEILMLTSTPRKLLISAAFGERLPFEPWRRVVAFFSAPTDSLMEAAAVEGRMAELKALDLTYTDFAALLAEGAFRPRSFALIYDLTAPSSQAAVSKAKATDSSRILAGGSLELAFQRLHGAPFPERFELPSTPYAGEAPIYERGDGWAELSVPTTSELFDRDQPGIAASSRPIFRWRVVFPETASRP